MRATAVALLVALSFAPSLAQQTESKPDSRPSQQAQQTHSQASKPAQGAAGKAAEAQQEGAEYKGPWKGLQYRLVGPYRGGRVPAVSGVVGQSDIYYMGAAAGGVWKTTDGGLNWKPLTDKTKDMSPSIGAIAVSESDPNVIYVGTGEACIRGNIVSGNGVYKSIGACQYGHNIAINLGIICTILLIIVADNKPINNSQCSCNQQQNKNIAKSGFHFIRQFDLLSCSLWTILVDTILLFANYPGKLPSISNVRQHFLCSSATMSSFKIS